MSAPIGTDPVEFSGLAAAHFDPTTPTDVMVFGYSEPRIPLRERLVSWLRAKLGIVGDRSRVLADAHVMRTLIAAQAKRLESLEKLVIEDSRVIKFHHEVMKRWATQSATLRDIEDVHAKKLRRAENERLAQQEEAIRAIEKAKKDADRPVRLVHEVTGGEIEIPRHQVEAIMRHQREQALSPVEPADVAAGS